MHLDDYLDFSPKPIPEAYNYSWGYGPENIIEGECAIIIYDHWLSWHSCVRESGLNISTSLDFRVLVMNSIICLTQLFVE